jgi:hypothetical protein
MAKDYPTKAIREAEFFSGCMMTMAQPFMAGKPSKPNQRPLQRATEIWSALTCQRFGFTK